MQFYMRTLATLCAIALIVATVPAVGLSANSPDFDVTVELPDELTTGENEIRVVVDNTENDEEFFSPLVEIPLDSSLSVPDADDPDLSVEYGGQQYERTGEVLNASYRDGDALVIYGEEVPAGESRTYVFTLDVDRAGSITIEADVRPLYNEQLNVREAVTETAIGTGMIEVTIEDEDGTIPGAITVDGIDRSADGPSLSVAEGDRDVSASANGRTLPTLTVALGDGETQHVRFFAPDSIETPTVVATSGNGSVLDGSVTRLTTQVGNAVQVTTFELSFVVDTEGGTTVVGIAPPPEIPDAFDDVSATVDGAPVSVETADDGTLVVPIEGAGDSDTTVSLTGYRTGDATESGGVGIDDARAVATVVAADGRVNPYADVDGNGEITAVDAMLIAQYDAGNRDVDFRRAN